MLCLMIMDCVFGLIFENKHFLDRESMQKRKFSLNAHPVKQSSETVLFNIKTDYTSRLLKNMSSWFCPNFMFIFFYSFVKKR
jgi:hypothetical protein